MGWKTLEELRCEKEFGVIDSVEGLSRDDARTDNVIIVRDSGYDVIGIVTTNPTITSVPPRVPRVWIIASSRYCERLKKMPSNGDYRLTHDQLDRIRQATRLSPDVQAEMEKHIAPDD
jgi:hypothetical protein